jgi:hypothetical protein
LPVRSGSDNLHGSRPSRALPELPLPARVLGALLRPRSRGRLLAAALLVPVAACQQDNSGFLGPATSENAERVASVWTLSGTPPALPAGFRFVTEQAVRPQMLPTGSLNFDLAVEFTADGRVQLLPARAVVPLPPAGGTLVGMLLSSTTFEAVQRAPERGYQTDSALVVAPRQLVLLRLDGVGCLFGDPYYAKMVVDSVIAAERRVVLRTMVNRNCGYRALTAGLPKN